MEKNFNSQAFDYFPPMINKRPNTELSWAASLVTQKSLCCSMAKLNRQAFAAFGTACIENCAAALRFHANTEAVGAFTTRY